MSIQVPSPSYGLVAGSPADPTAPEVPWREGAEKEVRAGSLAGGSNGWVPGRSGEPGCASAEPTTSGEAAHAASASRQNNAQARATDSLMDQFPLLHPAPDERELRD